MTELTKYKYLDKIDDPKDLRHLTNPELVELADEIRTFLIDTISQTGGHFAGSLGVVELTIALHKVFDTPKDLIIWDTGHQAYPHKILTGRRDRMNTIRQLNGLSGFLKRNESEYDTFGAGHAATSISAALGMATAAALKDEDRKVIAVIGDGAMTNGMAYEAMNNSGMLKKNLIVVLNDNQMSISPNVWQISNYFTNITAHPEYNRFKGAIWELTGKLDQFGDRLRKTAARLESGIKSIITPGMLFESLGFRYFGPFNGHNLPKLISTFNNIKSFHGPILVHINTKKGKGYKPAEEHVTAFHGISPFDKITGKTLPKKPGPPSYTSVFGNTLVKLMEHDKRLVGITAAMPDGTGMNIVQKAFPERTFDVGIAEEHAVTFAAGLATQGIKPVVAIYSTFMQRAIDQIIHDISLQKLNVILALDRGGLVGADGPTHHGVFDLTYLRMIPNIVVMAPKDENEFRHMLYTADKYEDGAIALRYPRGNGVGVPIDEELHEIEIGKAEKLTEGSDVALLAVGIMVGYSDEAVKKLREENISAELINMRFVKPLDSDMLDYVAEKFDKVVTLEENSIVGGFGAGVLEYFADKGYKNNVLRIGLPDDYVEHGTQKELHALLKIDPSGIAEQVKSFVKKPLSNSKVS
jgi:1-deoxy-D-xylulose-5-phosphate synthase